MGAGPKMMGLGLMAKDKTLRKKGEAWQAVEAGRMASPGERRRGPNCSDLYFRAILSPR